MELQKTCENCIHFCQHYYKSESGRFYKVFHDGFCLNNNLTKSVSKKIISKYLSCQFWQEAETQCEQENIFKVLCDINNRLNEIASILIDDKN